MLPGLKGMGGFIGGGGAGVQLIHESASNSETVNFGPDEPGRWIAVLGYGGNNVAAYDLSVSIPGGQMQVDRHSSGDGAGVAVATCMYVGQPVGSSGVITVSGAPPTKRFRVLRVIGYDLGSPVFNDDTQGSPPPWLATVPAGGLTIAHCARSFSGAHTWTGLTERIEAFYSNKFTSVAWDENMAEEIGRSIGFTPTSGSNGAESGVIGTFPRL